MKPRAKPKTKPGTKGRKAPVRPKAPKAGSARKASRPQRKKIAKERAKTNGFAEKTAEESRAHRTANSAVKT